MPSSKKKRGKQRKEAKRLASACLAVPRPQDTSTGKEANAVGSIEAAKNGHSLLENLKRDGLHTVLLNFLKSCEGEHFASVVTQAGGDLSSPRPWLVLTVMMCNLDGVSVDVAKAIGPLVRCMIDDETFFKSKELWRESISVFLYLISTLLDSGEAAANILLLQHDDMQSIARWIFWESLRPDIFCAEARTAAFGIICQLLDLTDRKKLHQTIGEMPIISQKYDPDCKVSFTVGIIRLPKETGDQKFFGVARKLIYGEADCVDKDVITEVLDYGCNFTRNKTDAVNVMYLAGGCCFQKTDVGTAYVPSDTRVAFAIRAGLLEMCLNFASRFGCSDEEDDEMNMIFYLLYSIYSAALHKKTARALEKKRSSILEEMECLEGHAECVDEVEVVHCIIALSSVACANCNATVCREDVKLCGGCKSKVYCCKACQIEDWNDGQHSIFCSADKFCINLDISYADKVVDSDNERIASKIDSLENNIILAQSDIFFTHKETIMAQLGDRRDEDLEDDDSEYYIVHFDLSRFENEPETVHYTEFFEDNPGKMKSFEQLPKGIFVCAFTSSLLYGKRLEDGDSFPSITLYNTFQVCWRSDGSMNDIILT